MWWNSIIYFPLHHSTSLNQPLHSFFFFFLALTHHFDWKRDEYPTALLMDNCAHSSLILYWYSTKTQQVVLSYRLVTVWNLRPYQWTFCIFSIRNPLVYLAPLNKSFTNACIGHLENIDSLGCIYLPHVYAFYYTA